MNTQQLFLLSVIASGLALAGCNTESLANTDEDPAAIEQPAETDTETPDTDTPDTGAADTETPDNNTSETNTPETDSSEPSEEESQPDPDQNSDQQPDTGTGANASDGHPLHSVHDTRLCIAAPNNQLTAVTCDDSPAQRWFFSNGQMRAAWNNQLCITAEALSSGASVSLQNCNNSAQQNWSYTQNSVRNGNWALDLNRSTNAVIVYSFHGGDNQLWLKEVGTTEGETSGAWAEVPVPPFAPYGTRSFDLPAAQNWVNTGLFLRAGQTASISATGSWNVKGGTHYGPDGTSSEQSRGCQLGELTARIGLYYKGPAISCIGSSATFTAHEDGIVYVGAVVSNDLGEAYDTRTGATGSVHVTITSSGETVPTIAHNEAANYDFAAVSSGWIEIRSEHNIMTLPIATAIKDAGKLEAAGERLDAIYKQHLALRGKQPYQGQAIRWYPDTKDAPGWMLAGNPVRMDPALVDHNGGSRITLIAEPANNGWGFAHELGHDFNFSGGDWYYTTFGGLEAWPNILTLHAIEKLGLPPRDLSDCAERKANYLAKNQHSDSFGDAWTGLCFLMEFQQAYGWDFYQRFYATFNTNPGHGWGFLHQRFSDAAGEDVGAIFDAWGVDY